jgi:hypothetical protein
MLNWKGRSGPLAVDTLTAFVQKEGSITGARVKLGEVIRNQLQVDVVPRPLPNPISRVRGLIAQRLVPLDAEIGLPRPAGVPGRGRELLARSVRSRKTAQIPRDAPLTRDKKAWRRTGWCRGSVLASDRDTEDREQK